MIIPLGLGYWPKKLPVAILLLLVVILGYSFFKFPDIQKHEADLKAYMDSNHITDLRIQIIGKACQTKLGLSDCAIVQFEKNPKDFAPTSVADLLKVVAYINQYNADLVDWPEEAKAQPEYAQLESAMVGFSVYKKQAAVENGLLIKENLDLLKIASANFSHANYSHLLGNIFFLLCFGLHLEMAFGVFMTGLTFLLGGLFGLFVESMFLAPGMVLLGSSAGVSAILGGYVVMFWKARMKFLFSLTGLYYKPYYLSVAWTVPIFYILNDIIGMVTRASGGGGVAHLSHLGGMAIGMAAAGLFQMTSVMRWPFLFEKELELYEESKTLEEPQDRLQMLLLVKAWNFQNYVVCHKTLEFINNNQIELKDPNDKKVVEWVKETLRYHMVKKEKKNTVVLLERVPSQLEMKSILKRIGWKKIMTIADDCLELEKYQLALTLYNILLEMNPKRMDTEGVKKTCENIEAFLAEAGSELNAA